MNPIHILQYYYDKDSRAYNILIEHGRRVTAKALEIADRVANSDYRSHELIRAVVDSVPFQMRRGDASGERAGKETGESGGEEEKP